WSPWIAESNRASEKPSLKEIRIFPGISSVAVNHKILGDFILFCDGDVPLLFTENETNHEKLFPGTRNESPYVKDGINDFIVSGNQEAVNPAKQGTKTAAHFQMEIGAGETSTIRVRLTKNPFELNGNFFGKSFDKIFADRIQEADAFYKSVIPSSVTEDKADIMRQALGGMLWSKQFF